MKKILLLGGSAQQIPAIETAKKSGYYTILCDYLPDNPGQYIADKFYLVSTTDIKAVLEIARNESVGGVLAYASDPAAPTAAYVAERLGLSGNPFSSVNILCNKDLFRAFLKKHDFNMPNFKSYASVKEAKTDLINDCFSFPVMVKPVDSSGSKGVGKIVDADNVDVFLENAMSFSRSGRIIVEEYIEQYGYQIAGDALSVNGKLVFWCFGNDHFNKKCENPFVPVSASFPCNMPDDVQNRIHDELQRLISLLNMGTCAYNFDIKIDNNLNIHLMEVAPRNGGNYIPQIIKYATGEDLVEYSVLAAMGEPVKEVGFGKQYGFYSYFAVHSLQSGTLDKIKIDREAESHILENHITKKSGEKVNSFVAANSTLGCLLMKFDNLNQMLNMMDNPEKWIQVLLN